MGMGMGVSFQCLMGVGMNMGVIFENGYECGHSSACPIAIPTLLGMCPSSKSLSRLDSLLESSSPKPFLEASDDFFSNFFIN